MNEQSVIRRISWRDLFPWLILFRTFRIAISPTLLALATLASIASFVGWWFAGLVFLPRPEAQSWWAPRSPGPLGVPDAAHSQLRDYLPDAVAEYLPAAPTAMLEGYFELAEPLKRLFDVRGDFTVRETAYYAFGVLWTLAIWAFAGGVITRRAVVQLGTETPLGIQSTATYAGRRYFWYFLTPLYPLAAIVLLAIPIALLGLPLSLAHFDALKWMEGLGAVLAGLVWIFVVIAGLGAMWLFGGLIFGWPLMWPAISAEREADPFEAFSRSFSYVYGRPLHYFFYVVVAALFGALCLTVVEGAAVLVREFGFWALSWGGGGASVSRIRELSIAVSYGTPYELSENERGLAVGTTLIGLVLRLVRTVVTAFTLTYFWTAASAIYLLLRMDVDHQEMDEVFLEDDPSKTPAAVPTAASPSAPVAASTPPGGVVQTTESAGSESP